MSATRAEDRVATRADHILEQMRRATTRVEADVKAQIDSAVHAAGKGVSEMAKTQAKLSTRLEALTQTSESQDRCALHIRSVFLFSLSVSRILNCFLSLA